MLLLTSAITFAANAQDPGFQETDVQKTSQTNFKFLSLSVDPRASAMGGAVVAQDMAYSNAMFYNPATMAYMQSAVSVGVMNTQWIADITYYAGSIAFRPGNGQFGVFGISAVGVNYGDFLGTVREAGNASGYRDTGTFSPSAMAVGFGYAKALTDRFAVGGNLKFAQQDLGSSIVDVAESGDDQSRDYSKGTMVFDFGALYQTGFRSMNFAVNVRNFARELKYEQENFELPLTFRIGVSMDMLDFAEIDHDMHTLRIAIDANRPRDFSEQIMVGGEYTFMKIFSLRAGYTFPSDLEGLNLGTGIQFFIDERIGGAINYSYTAFDVFDSVHRIGAHFSF
ncbi:MAG: PorV/PorQ family protein [Rhodothermales bacterium]